MCLVTIEFDHMTALRERTVKHEESVFLHSSISHLEKLQRREDDDRELTTLSNFRCILLQQPTCLNSLSEVQSLCQEVQEKALINRF
jgi:hypothetical protein